MSFTHLNFYEPQFKLSVATCAWWPPAGRHSPRDVPESLQVFLTLAEEKGKDYVSFFPPKENQTLGKLAKETARDSLVVK